MLKGGGAVRWLERGITFLRGVAVLRGELLRRGVSLRGGGGEGCLDSIVEGGGGERSNMRGGCPYGECEIGGGVSWGRGELLCCLLGKTESYIITRKEKRGDSVWTGKGKEKGCFIQGEKE